MTNTATLFTLLCLGGINNCMEKLIHAMRQVLATSFVLYMTTHGAHWNVEGPDFYQLHKMLDDQYNEIWAALDDIAEHLRALDAYTPQSLTRIVELSVVEESLPAPTSVHDYLTQLIMAHEALCDLMLEALTLAEECGQQGIVNFLGGRIEMHQKHRWMLRATAKRG